MNALYTYCLHLADNALVLGHRNSEWTGHGPILEQDIALSNISLDLIGQARNFYQLAAEIKNDGTTEDDLAYLRGAPEFLNCLLVEQENGHWGKTVLRQFFASAYHVDLYRHLQHSAEKRLAAIAEKSLKEVNYHLRWSSEWVIRLGSGTEESHNKMQQAVDELWRYTEEIYTPVAYESDFVSPAEHFASRWSEKVIAVLESASLQPQLDTLMLSGGKSGNHTPALTSMLEEMQYMQRRYPNMQW